MNIPDMKSPYKGLAPYDVADEDNFFGRDREKQILIGKIFSYNVTLFFAGTGVGKSSLLRAAVTPVLMKKHGLDVVYYADWVQDPIAGLKAEIEKTLIVNDKISGREVKGIEELHSVVETCTAYSSEPLVLIFDQFEELFRYQSRTGRLHPFVNQLVRVINDKDLPLSVVFAVREDFLADVNIFKGKIQGLFDNYYRLERLTASQARDAIERPVKKVGFRYEEGLIEHILYDLTEREQQRQEGAFSSAQEGQERYVEPPYLQIVCQKLWENEQHNPQKVIRTKTYNTLQGAEQIVKGHVEQVMEKLTLREQALAFQMFQYLVTSRGTKMAYRDEDLADTLGVPVAEVRPILEHLAGREVRILRLDNRPDGQWYELYHDVFADIIRGWTEQFREDDNRHLYSQITTATRKWQQQGQTEDALLKGGLLIQAETWIKDADHQVALLSMEREFLDLSVKHHYRNVWLPLAQILSFQALDQQLYYKDTISALLARQAYLLNERAQTTAGWAQIDRALRSAMDALRFKTILLTHNWRVMGLAFSPDSKLLASGVLDIRLWDAISGEERGVLTGHKRTVTSLAFSPDGQILASASGDQTVRLWDVASQKELAVLTGHQGQMNSVVFSPDGRILASASSDHTIRLWDVVRRTERAILEGHTLPVFSLSFSPDGKLLASGSWDTTVRIWDVAATLATDAANDAERAVLKGHVNNVNAVAFSPDGQIVASGGGDRAILLWNIVKREKRAVLLGHEGIVFAVAFSPDGATLASAGWDNTVRLWDISTELNTGGTNDKKRKILRGHVNAVASVAFSPDGVSLVSGSDDQTVRLWDMASIGEQTVLRGHEWPVFALTFSPNGLMLASGSWDNTVRLWDTLTRTERIRLSNHKGAIRSLNFSLDGTTLASGSEDQTVRLWDMADGKERAVLPGHVCTKSGVAFSPDGLTLASTSVDNTVRLWDVTSGTERVVLRGHLEHVFAVAFSPDGQALASGSEDRTIWLWDTVHWKKQTVLKGHEGPIYALAFSPDNTFLASMSGDKTVRLWDVVNGQELAVLPGDETDLNQVAFSLTFSPNGQTLAYAGSRANTIRLWDVSSGKTRAVLRGHDQWVFSLAFSPDSQTLASASEDMTVRLWDVASGTERAILRGHKGGVVAVAFSPDGQTLASGGGDFAIRLWEWPTKRLAEMVCQKVWRNLTQEEWQQFVGSTIPYERTCPNLPVPPDVKTSP